MITAISGLPGSGKTDWIREQIAQAQTPVLYFSPQTEAFPIDAIRLESEFPLVEVFPSAQSGELLQFAQAGGQVYLELPWYLDLSACELLLQRLECYRVAIMPPNLTHTGWHAWADEVIPGNLFEGTEQLQIQRGLLTEEVVDFASLETFWRELTQGAYGKAIRAKGIFDIADGQSIYGDFLWGLPEKEFESVNLPRWLSGRPQRFSGLEIIGCNLDKKTIVETLGDLCLSESAILAFQKQVAEELAA